VDRIEGKLIMRWNIASVSLVAVGAVAAVVGLKPAAAMSVGAQPQGVHPGASYVLKVDTKGDANNGRKLFLEDNCYICRGGRGGGGMCISLRASRPDDGDVRDALLRGEPSGMPSFAALLSDQDIADIAAYIHSMRSANEPTFVEWWLH
jgi:mono/diheme cytochrome c family protein